MFVEVDDMETNWIRKRRDQLNLKQEELATRLQLAGFNITRAAVSHWESERYIPPLHNPEFRKALASALKMTPQSMLLAAGYEVKLQFSDDAMHAADIVEQLPDDKKRLALGILEQILEGA